MKTDDHLDMPGGTNDLLYEAVAQALAKEERMLTQYKTLHPDAKGQIALHSYAASVLADIAASARVAVARREEGAT